LELEAKERLVQQKTVRRQDKRAKELTLQLEDEKRNANNMKEQVDKLNARVKGLKRQLDEAEEEISREKAVKRKLQRDLEDVQEGYESLVRENGSLKNKLRRGTGTSLSLSSSRLAKRGSLNSTSGPGEDAVASQEESFDGEDEKA